MLRCFLKNPVHKSYILYHALMVQSDATGHQAELKLLPDAHKNFRKITKFRQPEYNVRKLLSDTLNHMEADGILKKVDSARVVSPMRIVEKGDKR